jgi:anti-sigma B factor antagonist
MTGKVQIRYQSLGDCLIVRVAGEVDSLGARVLRDTLVGKVSDGDARMVVDLSRVDTMDATGLTALLVAHQEAEASGGSMRLVGVGEPVQTVLELTDQAGALMVDDDMSDALEATMEAAAGAVRRRRQLPRPASAADVRPRRLRTRPR